MKGKKEERGALPGSFQALGRQPAPAGWRRGKATVPQAAARAAGQVARAAPAPRQRQAAARAGQAVQAAQAARAGRQHIQGRQQGRQRGQGRQGGQGRQRGQRKAARAARGGL